MTTKEDAMIHNILGGELPSEEVAPGECCCCCSCDGHPEAGYQAGYFDGVGFLKVSRAQ